jgi:hypothetical protein
VLEERGPNKACARALQEHLASTSPPVFATPDMDQLDRPILAHTSPSSLELRILPRKHYNCHVTTHHNVTFSLFLLHGNLHDKNRIYLGICACLSLTALIHYLSYFPSPPLPLYCILFSTPPVLSTLMLVQFLLGFSRLLHLLLLSGPFLLLSNSLLLPYLLAMTAETFVACIAGDETMKRRVGEVTGLARVGNIVWLIDFEVIAGVVAASVRSLDEATHLALRGGM